MQTSAHKVKLVLLKPYRVGLQLKAEGDTVLVSRSAAKSMIGSEHARLWTTKEDGGKETVDIPKPPVPEEGLDEKAEAEQSASDAKEAGTSSRRTRSNPRTDR